MLRLETSLLVKSKIRFYQKKTGQFFTSSHIASVPWARAVELATWHPRLDPWFLYFKKKTKWWKVVPNKNLVAQNAAWRYFLKHKNFNARKPCWFILMISNVHKLNHRRSASRCKLNNPQGPFFFYIPLWVTCLTLLQFTNCFSEQRVLWAMRFSTTRHSRASSSLMYSSRQIRCGTPQF